MNRPILDIIVIVAFCTVTITFYCLYEDWAGANSTLFVFTTMASVGFGYSTPTDDWSRLFTIFVMIFGVLVVFTVIFDFVHYLLTKLSWFLFPFAKREHYKVKLVMSLCYIFVVLLIGTVFISLNEGKTFITALYLTVQTSTVSFKRFS